MITLIEGENDVWAEELVADLIGEVDVSLIDIIKMEVGIPTKSELIIIGDNNKQFSIVKLTVGNFSFASSEKPIEVVRKFFVAKHLINSANENEELPNEKTT